LKVVVLLLVRPTGDLRLIAFASVIVVVAESGIFIWQLRAAGSSELWRAATAMLRMIVAAVATAGLLYLLVPGAWQVVSLGRWSALFAGVAAGLLTYVIFFALQAMLWVLFRRPRGPEAQLWEALRQFDLFCRIEKNLLKRINLKGRNSY
jgi:hypothetical protein